jgi:hypothetical protein
MDRSEQDGEGNEKSGKTRHLGAPCVFAAECARKSGVGWNDDATGGSAVPAIPRTYGPTGYRKAQQ